MALTAERMEKVRDLAVLTGESLSICELVLDHIGDIDLCATALLMHPRPHWLQELILANK